MIKGRLPGDNITLLNAMYFKKTEFDANGKTKYNDYMTLVYKDCNTGLKYKEEIKNPDYEFYVANDDKRETYNRLFIPAQDCHKVSTPYMEVERTIAKMIGCENFYFENIKNQNFRKNRELHLHPDIFDSDSNIEDHYRYRFDKLYKNEPCVITKAFFDIETDPMGFDRDVILEHGECPINAISIILQETREVYTLLLRNKKNPLIEEFENEIKNNRLAFFNELSDFIVNAAGGPEVAHKYNINFKYNFMFYNEEDEINLIRDAFALIHKAQPDFLLAWNMSFDMTFILNRIVRLGYNPYDIISHPDFTNKFVNYYVDTNNKNEFAERGDRALVTGYTVFLDQMIQFASRRKGRAQFPSYRLDAIGERIAKVRKLDYKHITSSIVDLPYLDYKTFVFYNIMDTIVQYCIEYVTDDIGFVFTKTLLNNTRYDKIHRQTVYLTNRGRIEFYRDGYIIGNNTNINNPAPQETFSGAYVADPTLIDNTSRMLINDQEINVFNNLLDEDYSALYPSINRQYNLAPNTQTGRLLMYEQVHDKENLCRELNWNRGGSFAEDFVSQNFLEFCCRWLHLGSYMDVCADIEYLYTNLWNPYYGFRLYNRDGTMNLMTFDDPNRISDCMVFDEDYEDNVQDIYINPDLVRWEEFRNAAYANPNQCFRIIDN